MRVTRVATQLVAKMMSTPLSNPLFKILFMIYFFWVEDRSAKVLLLYNQAHQEAEKAVNGTDSCIFRT
jgi:hypothetical protein